jgi:hypothetical protein
LAKEAQQCAYAAIAADPGSDVAHHLMGRWHYEMAQINGLLRALVRIMYGTALAPGTRQDALASFRRAVELAPGRLIHRVEAGRVHLELGQVAEGVEQLEVRRAGCWAAPARSALPARPFRLAARPRAAVMAGTAACCRGLPSVHPPPPSICRSSPRVQAALECEVEDINAWHTRMDAEKLLAQVRRQPWKQPSLVPPHAQQQERERGGAGGAPAASMSTAALLSGHRQPEIVSEALLSASAASAPPPAPAA